MKKEIIEYIAKEKLIVFILALIITSLFVVQSVKLNNKQTDIVKFDTVNNLSGFSDSIIYLEESNNFIIEDTVPFISHTTRLLYKR